jgi:hypothetical protein
MPSRVLVPVLVVLALGAGVYCGFSLVAAQREAGEQLGKLSQQVAELERAVHLLRIERQSTVGAGVPALLEQLRYWAPQLEAASTPQAEMPAIRQRIGDVMKAVAALGKDAYPAIAAEFDKHADDLHDELRRWLLRAASAADPTRGRDLLIQVLRALQRKVSTRLREFAADELTAIDKPAAGAVLRSILQYESSRGISADRIPPELLALRPETYYGHSGHFPGFFNFVIKYAATGDPEIDLTLTMLLGRHEHDLPTIQAAVKELGARKYKGAAARIRELYASPPGIPDNPLFQLHCLDALAAIEGRGACDFFEQEKRRARHEMLVGKLNELTRTLCR